MAPESGCVVQGWHLTYEGMCIALGAEGYGGSVRRAQFIDTERNMQGIAQILHLAYFSEGHG